MKEITYTMREDGLMYPDLTISEKKIELGPFAMKRKSFLQQHRRSLFALLVMKGQLTEHLAEIEQRAIDMLEKLTEQMAQTMGVTDQQVVRLQAYTDRPLIFDDMVVRVSPQFQTRVHLDYDEANACGFQKGDLGRILS